MNIIFRTLPTKISYVSRFRFGQTQGLSNVVELKVGSEWKTLVVESKTPVVVDFFAHWCGPCKRLSPMINEQAKQYEGKVKVVLVDIDEHQDLASSNNVQAVPTVKLFVGGKVKDEFTGIPNPARLNQFFQDAFKV